MEIIRTYYDDEKTKKYVEYTQINGIMEGLYKAWHPTGEKHLEQNYKNNIRDGLCEKWYNDGTKCEESNYKNGGFDGTYRDWFKTGNKWEESTYKNCKLDGLCKIWNSRENLIRYTYNLPDRVINLRPHVYGYKSLVKLITSKKRRRINKNMHTIRTQLSVLNSVEYNCIIEYLEDIEKVEILREYNHPKK